MSRITYAVLIDVSWRDNECAIGICVLIYRADFVLEHGRLYSLDIFCYVVGIKVRIDSTGKVPLDFFGIY